MWRGLSYSLQLWRRIHRDHKKICKHQDQEAWKTLPSRRYRTSAVAQHMVKNPEHKITFNDTEVICNMQHYYPRLLREAIEIYKHKNNCNKKEEGLKIHKTWYPALKMCKVKPLITKSRDIETDQSGFSCLSAGQSHSSSTHAPRI